MRIRYIKCYAQGHTNNVNNTDWTEIKAINYKGNNMAYQKQVTGSFTPTWGTFDRVTDGVTEGNFSVGTNNGQHVWVQVDLGGIYSIDYLHIWHYNAGARKFKNVQITVSKNGTDWKVIFDSNKEGMYDESTAGRIFKLPFSADKISEDTPLEQLKENIDSIKDGVTVIRDNLKNVLVSNNIACNENETLTDLVSKVDIGFDNIMSSMPKWNGIWADLLKPHPVSGIYLMGTSVIGDIVYFTGGGTYNQRYQYNYSYNTITNTWTKLANVPILISYTTSAAHNTNVYMFSGKNNTTTGSKSTYQYDTVSNTWTAKANILTNVSESSSETIGDNIYIIGGTNLSASSSTANINQCYNVLTNTWTSKATMPTAINRHASVVKGNTIYIVGRGYTYAYTPDTNSWTTLAGCSVSHQYAGAGIIDNEIYVVGGMDSNTSVYIYNIDNNTWGTGTNVLPSGNNYTSAEVVNGVLYAFLTASGSKTYCLLNSR